MTNSYKSSPRRGGSSSFASLTSSSYSLSLSGSGSSSNSSISSSSSSSASSAPASADGALRPGDTVAAERKPFVPPKILRAKNIPPLKKQLPRRAPPPSVSIAAGGAAGPNAVPPPSRKEQLAALQSQLLMSRAAIGQRWKEAWRSAESSAFSYDSDIDDLEEFDSSSDSSRAATPASRKKEASDKDARDNGNSVGSSLTASAARKDLLQLLEREMSSSSSDLQDDGSQILNLTASDFIDDLKADLAPHEGEEVRPATPVEETIISRPLRKLKLHLFHEGHPGSSSSSDGSSEGSASSIRWRQLPSRETSVPGELDGDLQDSEDEAKEEEEEEADEQEGDEDEKESSASQSQEGEGSEENYGESDVDRDGEAKEERRDEENAVAELSEAAEGEPQMIWQFDEPDEGKPSPPEPKKTIVVRRPLKAADMDVEERLEVDACQEDFDRREMADRIVYEYTDDPLTPQMEKLRAERVKLAEWARKLRAGGRTQAEGERPAGYRPPLVRPPVLLGVGRTFPQTEVERPLTKDLSPRGEGIEERLLQRALLPSTKVWQMEQRTKRLQQQTVQQRQQLELLQAALRKKIEADTNTAASSANGERKERAQHLQAEEQLKDLQERVEAETNKRLLERSCRQQRDQQATTLQQRYSQLLHYLQEAEEKRSSFEDGLRVAQSKAQKAEALLQTKEAELAYAQRCLDTLDVQMLEKEVQRRKERDRANAAEQQVEELRAALAAKEKEMSKLMASSEGSATLLEKEQEEHRKTREALEAAQAALKQQAAEMQAPRLQQDKLESLRKLAKDFQALSAETEAEEQDMETWHREVEERKAKALSILEAAIWKPGTGKLKKEKPKLSQFSRRQNVQPSPSSLSLIEERRTRQLSMEALRLARQEEVAVLEREFEQAGKQRKKLEADLQQREAEAADLRRQVSSVSRKLQRQAQKNRRISKRIIRTAPAYGRCSRRTVCQELRTMRVGGVIELLTKSANRRPEPRYIKLFKRGVVMWTEDLAGKRGFKKGDQFSVKDIIGIDFGTSSSAFLWSLHGPKGEKASSSQFPYPWRCFTVRTLKDTFEFRAKSDDVAQDWVVGLGRLSSTHGPPMIVDKHELIVHRVRMKLDAYAAQRGITPAVMWKEAINRTTAQLPNLRQRPAGRRDSSEAQLQHRRDSTISHRKTTGLRSDDSPSKVTSPHKERRRHSQQDRSRDSRRRGHRESSRRAEQRSGQQEKQQSHADSSFLSQLETPSPTTAGAVAPDASKRSRSPRRRPREAAATPDETLRRRMSSKTPERAAKESSVTAARESSVTAARESSVRPALKNHRGGGERTDSPVSSPPEASPAHGNEKTHEETKMKHAKIKQSRRRRQQKKEKTDEEGSTPKAAAEYRSVKKISKGILSRAGTLFRKPTKKTGE
ncbi:LOW QUALITY PROTEIN: uncharacterized protein EMH_0061240 [Eimeria mitis]|uniref:PH domain-containing protein n=1 Tax=Eimeria mitis TaxID=44415 RepID=U6KDP5_9EIME|nr:LOW QUALITY PROTEIN: uncharacterized protein EMH_0061240 [Eimeria mitis]CDJ34337.1 hypothetical protein, conserved [Eimeria mitis]